MKFLLVLPALALGAILINWFLGENQRTKTRLVRWARVGDFDLYMECEYRTTWVRSFFRWKKERHSSEHVLYRGSSTVWHVYPSGARSNNETVLAQIKERIEWGLCEELRVSSDVLEQQYKQTLEKT